MTDKMKNLLIGIFVASAIAIVISMIMFLHPSVGDRAQEVRVRFTDIDKVNVGTLVTFAGKPVGEVVEIIELLEAREGRAEWKGDVYVYELLLVLDSSVKIYNTDKISLRTSGLLGEKSVSIDPEPPRHGEKLRIINDEIIYADGVGSVEQAFTEIKEVVDRFDNALDMVTDALLELKQRHVWENIANTAENLSEMSTKFIEKWHLVDESMANLADTSLNAKEISQKIVDGEGTAGKLIASDDLYLKTTSLLSKGETILDDINHYGILFHLDNGWQRLRARRMNMLQKLQTPQEFRNYFNDEINQISTSLSRVNHVLDKSERYPHVIQDSEFQKVFAELLRRIGSLEEELRMYNTQANQVEVQKTELLRRR